MRWRLGEKLSAQGWRLKVAATSDIGSSQVIAMRGPRNWGAQARKAHVGSLCK
jgi:hypothetical protein